MNVFVNGILLYFSEHKELLHQIQEANDQHVRDDLERELDCLVARMEVKSDQITRLRRYQETVGIPL